MAYQRYLKSQEIVYCRKVGDEIIGRRVNLQEYNASHLLDEGLQGKAESMREMPLSVSLGKLGKDTALTVRRLADDCHGRLGELVAIGSLTLGMCY